VEWPAPPISNKRNDVTVMLNVVIMIMYVKCNVVIMIMYVKFNVVIMIMYVMLNV